MSFIGNIFWIILGGLISSICWGIAGLILCLTIFGIPFGIQCFKIAGLVLAPFGRTIESGNMGAMGLIGNILWLVFLGLELAICHVVCAIICAVTVVGIPFAIQHIKLAQLSIMPFGSVIR